MRLSILLLSAALLAFAPVASKAADTSALTDAQKAAVEDVVRELLVKKEPELVMKAAQELESRQEKEMASKSEKALSDKDTQDKLMKDTTAPVAGNPNGAVVLIEFFDYQCGYCKAVSEFVNKAIAENKDLKVVYKEYPVLGEGSVMVSKAALASAKQGKYVAFHNALMASKEHFTEESVMKIAKSVGLDTEKLKKDMADTSITKTIKENQALGQSIGARGTPTFVIGGKVYPGAMPYEAMSKKIEEARTTAKK